MELLLVRHAEPLRVEVEEGPADPPLSDKGYQQSARLAGWLESEQIDAVCGSPLRRAVETAAPLADRIGLPYETDERLAEYDKDSSVYIPVEELRALKDERWRALVEGRLSADGAQVDHETFVRDVVAAIEDVIARHAGPHRVAVVCHGGVINTYVGHILGIRRVLWFEPRYTSISRVLASRGGVRSVASLNEIAHLRDSNLL